MYLNLKTDYFYFQYTTRETQNMHQHPYSLPHVVFYLNILASHSWQSPCTFLENLSKCSFGRQDMQAAILCAVTAAWPCSSNLRISIFLQNRQTDGFPVGFPWYLSLCMQADLHFCQLIRHVYSLRLQKIWVSIFHYSCQCLCSKCLFCYRRCL